jgi:ABC-type proline/glycine betaine transport system substrate-binding protein
MTRLSKKQAESTLQRQIVDSLKAAGFGYFFRIRNGATYDPVAKIFRSNVAEKGIVDILGWTTHPLPVAIECKYIQFPDKKQKITHKVNISDEQKDFLLKCHSVGGRAGIAYTLEDAWAIVCNNPEMHPRHPRTYAFLSKEEIEVKAQEYVKLKSQLALNNKDIIYRMEARNKPEML